MCMYYIEIDKDIDIYVHTYSYMHIYSYIYESYYGISKEKYFVMFYIAGLENLTEPLNG